MEQPGRLRLRGWLEEQIESGKYPGVSWLDKTGGIFQIPWKHAARHGWSIDRDATLFRNWAMHTGRYRPGKHKPDPKTWKANFRCALNSLPDICELHEHSKKRGNNAYRVYKMLPSTHTLRRRRGFQLMSPAQEQQAFSSADACNLHAWQPTTSICDSSLDMEIPADVAFHNTQTHGHWEAKPATEEQNEAVFKLMDQLGNTDLWSQTGSQRGWRTHTLWDHTHWPSDENTFSLQTDGYSELFAPNYIKDVSDWSTSQPTLMP